jgi:acyl CoA:acetate/3-ketoacid CoA transferase beta subunit
VVERCTYPLTATAAVDTIVTEFCVFRRVEGRLCLTELLDGGGVADVEAATTARFDVVLATQSA